MAIRALWLVVTLERQIADLPLPLALKAAINNQDWILDGATDAEGARHLEHTGHPQARGHTVVRMLGQRRHVMRYEHASLLGSPFENGRIVRAKQPDFGWSKGRNDRYAYYHCQRQCRAVNVSKKKLETISKHLILCSVCGAVRLRSE